MKLWQKISLIALVFVTLAVQLTQFYILDSHFRSAIAREVNSAASAHSALAASLSNHAAYERLKANTLFLSTDQLTDMLKDTITTDISTADVIEVKKGGKTITAVGTEVLDGASYDLASVKPNDAITDGKTVIFDAGEKTYLMVVSIIKLEAMSYELRTVYDVTNVYDEHDANLNNARMWGLCCGGGISVLLLISVLGFLRPVKARREDHRRGGRGRLHRAYAGKGQLGAENACTQHQRDDRFHQRARGKAARYRRKPQALCGRHGTRDENAADEHFGLCGYSAHQKRCHGRAAARLCLCHCGGSQPACAGFLQNF